MEKYWNLVEAHGRQVLIRKTEDSDGNPSIQLVTYIGGGEVSMGLNFEPKGQDFAAAEADRDLTFTKEAELVELATKWAAELEGMTKPMDILKICG